MSEPLRSRMQSISLRKVSGTFQPSCGALAFIVFAVFLLLHSVSGVAQSGATGTIVGTVPDASGAVVPGAAVSVINVGTNTHQNTVTSPSGTYSVPGLLPGS